MLNAKWERYTNKSAPSPPENWRCPVAKNISQHLIEHFASKKGLPTAGVLLAGDSSNSMALVLAQIGWQVTVLKVAELGLMCDPATVVRTIYLSDVVWSYMGRHTSYTNSAAWRSSSYLEGLANHRGSLLGEEWEENLLSTKAKIL